MDRRLAQAPLQHSRIDQRRFSFHTLRHMDFGAHSILWVLVIGLVIGAIAKLLMPGKDPGGCIITILLGIAGAFVGTWHGRLGTGNETYQARWLMSIVGAMILLLLYRLIVGRRGSS